MSKESRQRDRQERKVAKKRKISTSKLAKLVFDVDDSVKSFITNSYKSSNKIIEITNVIYDPAESDVCMLDLFKPELVLNSPLPVLVNVHGGGWVTGDKRWRVAQGRIFADMGMCVININYGLSPKYRYHQSLRHVLTAMKWLENNAKEYNLDLKTSLLWAILQAARLRARYARYCTIRSFLQDLESISFIIV